MAVELLPDAAGGRRLAAHAEVAAVDVATREEAAAWLHGGLNVLPAAIAQRPLNAQYACTALIYQFRKLGFQGEPVSVMDGAPGASLQLQRTGILDQNGRLRR